MKKIFTITIALIFLLLLISVAYPYSLRNKASELSNGARYEPTECWFEQASFDQVVKWSLNTKMKRIECGYFSTRKEQGKSLFRLPVVIIRHSRWRNSQHPIINIAGGPGGSAWLDSSMIHYFWLPEI